MTLDASETYDRLISTLDDNNATYRLIDHPPEGRTELVSELRSHDPAAAAKCMVVMVKIGRKERTYVLAVVPGNCRVDLNKIKALLGGRYAAIAGAQEAEQMTGCAVGTVLPFTWNPALELVVDPEVFEHPELFFNAARLDRSVALASEDYLRVAHPRQAAIAEAAHDDPAAAEEAATESPGKRPEGERPVR